MKSLNVVLLCGGLVVLALVCHVATGGEPPPQLMINDQGVWYRADLQADQDVFGKTISTAQGALIDLALVENPTTGYTWKCTADPKSRVTVVRSAFVAPNAEPGLVGAPGMKHFLLLVSQPGKTRVTVQYGRWWGKEREEPKSFTIEATETDQRP